MLITAATSAPKPVTRGHRVWQFFSCGEATALGCFWTCVLDLLLVHVDPVLKLLRHDHVEHDDGTRRALDAARGEIEGAFNLHALVDDKQELAKVARLEGTARFLRTHARMLP